MMETIRAARLAVLTIVTFPIGALTAAGVYAAPAVVTDTPVVHSLVAQVMEGVGAPILLLDQGADPHDFQLRPSQAAALSDADLVVWIGPEMTPWLAKGLGAADVGRALALLSVEGTILREAGSHDHDHGDHADETQAKDDHDHDGHTEGGRDPHAWLDPRNAETWVAAIAADLSAIDPANAAAYAANADTARAAIRDLDADLATRLAPARGQPLAVYHDAYGYFADRYGLTIVGSLAEGDAHDPGAAHLADLQSRLGGAACLFPESGHDTGAPETLAVDAGVRIGPALDPEGIGIEPGPGLYPALMTGLADGILSCVAAN